MNGEVWLPRASGNCYDYIVQFYKSRNTLSIRTNQGCGKGFQINLTGLTGMGDIAIGTPVNNAYRYDFTAASCALYDLWNSTQTGTVSITRFDTAARIVSGRFSGVLKQTGCPDVSITEGRFDFQMTVYN